MIFTEFKFIALFGFFYIIYWFIIKGNTSRKVLLLFASYAFYSAWNWKFLCLIFAYTCINYTFGLTLKRDRIHSKKVITFAVIVNLGFLGLFKYYNFFVNSAVDFLALLGFSGHYHTLTIILPVGISFYTFRSISYCADVYRGHVEPSRNLLDFFLYVSFFPQLLAGPIDRASHFLPQLRENRILSGTGSRLGINLFILGFIKKAIISDNISSIVDLVFLNPTNFDVLATVTAVLLYSVQIYCDFSGYSDMANGITRMLGFEPVNNFFFPYFSRNITDFWRRWHISLSNWLKDYLYIPLGGNRGSRFFIYRNLLITFLLCGLWHGAGWNFILWGGLHGAALIVHKAWKDLKITGNRLFQALWNPFSYLATFCFVTLCWIFFRAESFDKALLLISSLFALNRETGQSVSPYWLLFLAFIPIEYCIHLFFRKENYENFLAPNWAYSLMLGALVAILLLFVPLEEKPFIYLQF